MKEEIKLLKLLKLLAKMEWESTLTNAEDSFQISKTLTTKALPFMNKIGEHACFVRDTLNLKMKSLL